VLDLLDDVVDDIAVLYRVPYDDVLQLPSSRFFSIAERLPLRGGAVTAALTDKGAAHGGDQEWLPGPDTGPASPSVVAAGTANDIASLAAASQHPGFPGIGYSGG
jgi:hypothetical protein